MSDFEKEVAEFIDGLDSKEKNCMFYAEPLDSFDNLSFNIQLVEQHGGEGEGDQYWSVWKFSKGSESVYYKFYGWYASYNGAEFTEVFRVHPKQVLVTQYHS